MYHYDLFLLVARGNWGNYIASEDDDRWMYGSCTMEKSVPPPARPTVVPLVPAQPAATAAPELPFNPSLLRTSAPVALTTQGKGGNTEAVKGRCLGDGLFPRSCEFWCRVFSTVFPVWPEQGLWDCLGRGIYGHISRKVAPEGLPWVLLYEVKGRAASPVTWFIRRLLVILVPPPPPPTPPPPPKASYAP